MRAEAVRCRNAAAGMHGGKAARDAAEQLALHVLSLFPADGPARTIAGYMPIGSEIDPRPALRDLERRGHSLCLPVVVGDDRPLEFRAWGSGDPLEDGAFDVKIPTADAPVVTPDAVLVPGLAFDGDGFRIGYGKGYYDRTLTELRARGPVLVAGLAYAVQMVDAVPHEGHDAPLDMVVTEKGIFLPGAAR